MFIEVNDTLVNVDHVVQLSPQGALQLTSGSVVHCKDKEEYEALRASMHVKAFRDKYGASDASQGLKAHWAEQQDKDSKDIPVSHVAGWYDTKIVRGEETGTTLDEEPDSTPDEEVGPALDHAHLRSALAEQKPEPEDEDDDNI